MFQIVNHNTLEHALLCIWLPDMYPCKDESIIIIGGTADRNIWRIRMGKYPVITWLTTALQEDIRKLYFSCKYTQQALVLLIKQQIILATYNHKLNKLTSREKKRKKFVNIKPYNAYLSAYTIVCTLTVPNTVMILSRMKYWKRNKHPITK